MERPIKFHVLVQISLNRENAQNIVI